MRTGTAADCAGVLELWAASGTEPSSTDTADALLCLMRTDEQALLLATVDGAVVGSVIAGWDGWRGRLYRLAVHPRCRRRGVATQLVRHAEERLRKRGATRIDAIVADDDGEARRFWTSVGYGHHRHRSRFIRDV